MDNEKFVSFLFRESWWGILKNLPTKDKGLLLEIICDYVFYNKEPQVDKLSLIGMAFLFIQRDIDIDKNKYANTKNKRSLAGKKGMESRWAEKNAQKNSEETPKDETKKSETENLNDDTKKESGEKTAENSILQKITKITNVMPYRENEKNKEILTYSLYLLSQGRPNAYSEAEKVYEYYEAIDWTIETIKPNGDKVVKKCKNHVAFLKAGTPKNEQLFSPADGALLATIIERTGCKQQNKDIIDNFRGFNETEDGVLMFLYTNIKSFQKFQKAFDNDIKFNRLVSVELQKVYPNSTAIDYRAYK